MTHDDMFDEDGLLYQWVMIQHNDLYVWFGTGYSGTPYLYVSYYNNCENGEMINIDEICVQDIVNDSLYDFITLNYDLITEYWLSENYSTKEFIKRLQKC